MKSEKLLRIFYPKRCSICSEIIELHKDYCGCEGKEFLSFGLDFCDRCGGQNGRCACSKAYTVKLEHITAPFVYSSIAKEMLLDLKFHGVKKNASFFSKKMSYQFVSAYPKSKADFVTFVPMTAEREKERGYNQSRLLASGVSKQLFLPLKEVLFKTDETQPQHLLGEKDRMKNLTNVFCISDETQVYAKTVILCDDIKTTGTTLKRCCDVLYAAGAKEIYCLCAAVSDFGDLF